MGQGGIDFCVSLQGSLRSLSIPDLLSLLHQHKKSGLLSLVSRSDERGVLFHNGNLVYATSCDGSRRLGNFLVRLGLLSEKELSSSAGSRGVEPAFLGQELVARGVIRAEDLHAAVREQILDILDEALLWEDGAFHFDERIETSSLPTGPVIRTHSILLDAIRRFDESQLIRASFPDLSVVLRCSASHTAGESALEPPAREILSLVDGKRTVVQILRASERSPYETALTLTTLSKEGHLQPAAAPASEELPSIPEPWALPVAPDLPGRIYGILRQSKVEVEQLAEAVGREPALAAKALRQFTAARLEAPLGELSISRILSSLGDLRARALVIPEVIRGVFFAEKEFFWKDCREHSLLSAHLSRELAQRVNYHSPDQAYLAGLLHKLGVFIFIGVYPGRYRAVLEEARSTGQELRLLEEMEFGLSHVKMGSFYADRWQFPRPILQAIKHHTQIGEGGCGPLVDLVAIASWIARNHGVGLEFSSSPEREISGALARFKLRKKNVMAISENAAQAAMALY
jgi:HD-like signal output (HDOD) protein